MPSVADAEAIWEHVTAARVLSRTAPQRAKPQQQANMPQSFKIGDHVSWNSEAGRVSGTIIGVHTRDFDNNGYAHHATPSDPQYKIKSAKTDHIAVHKGSALTKSRD